MANEVPDRGPEPTPGERRDTGPSDLIGVRLTLYLGVAILAILASFTVTSVAGYRKTGRLNPARLGRPAARSGKDG